MKSVQFNLKDTAQVNCLLQFLKENWRKAVVDGKNLIVTVTNKDEECVVLI